MRPNYPCYQQQPGYGAHPPNYGGMMPHPQTPRLRMMPGRHTPAAGSMPGPITPQPGMMPAPYSPYHSTMSVPRAPVPEMTGPLTQGSGMMSAPPPQGHGITPPSAQGPGMMPPSTQGIPPQHKLLNEFVRTPQASPSSNAHQMGGLSLKDASTPGLMPPRGPAPATQKGISPQYRNGNAERPYMQQHFPNQYGCSAILPNMNEGPISMGGMKDGLMPRNQQQMGMLQNPQKMGMPQNQQQMNMLQNQQQMGMAPQYSNFFLYTYLNFVRY